VFSQLKIHQNALNLQPVLRPGHTPLGELPQAQTSSRLRRESPIPFPTSLRCFWRLSILSLFSASLAPRHAVRYSLLKDKTRSSAIAVIAERTACSILTLFIVIATSRPLNKKSVCCQSADPTITADLRPQSAVRTPLLHLQSHRVTVHGTVSLLTNEPCLFDSQPESHRHLWRFSLRILWCIFVAKRYILQQKCLNF